MGWFSRSTFITRISRHLVQCGLQPKCKIRDGVAVTITLESSYLVEIEEMGKFVRLTGHPNVEFSPRLCPQNLLAHLLLRNGESNPGGWRLILGERRVAVCYSLGIPQRHLSRSSLKLALETVLAEVTQFALEYGHFRRA